MGADCGSTGEGFDTENTHLDPEPQLRKVGKAAQRLESSRCINSLLPRTASEELFEGLLAVFEVQAHPGHMSTLLRL